MTTSERFARAAEEFVGTPFRLHGRDAQTGVDCVGVVIGSLRAINRHPADPAGYALRNSDLAPFLELFGKAGLHSHRGSPQIGDVVQVSPGPGQLHLLVTTAAGDFVHAHATLRRVIRSPAPLPWAIDRLWRLAHQ